MSTVDLIVLGILLKNPMNAYELVRFINERQVGRVLKVSDPAIFKSCRRLAANGFLNGETVHEQGVPDKVIYQINDQGRERLYQLMSYFAQNIKPYYLEINTVLWNIDTLGVEKGRELLSTLQSQLHALKHGVIEHENEMATRLPFGPRQIVKQYRMTITTLVDWIDEVVVDFDALNPRA